jgi:hypothetical protein
MRRLGSSALILAALCACSPDATTREPEEVASSSTGGGFADAAGERLRAAFPAQAARLLESERAFAEDEGSFAPAPSEAESLQEPREARRHALLGRDVLGRSVRPGDEQQRHGGDEQQRERRDGRRGGRRERGARGGLRLPGGGRRRRGGERRRAAGEAILALGVASRRRALGRLRGDLGRNKNREKEL